jgi:hypothetical protein
MPVAKTLALRRIMTNRDTSDEYPGLKPQRGDSYFQAKGKVSQMMPHRRQFEGHNYRSN